MTTTTQSFERTLETTHQWLDELNEKLGRDDRHDAYRILRAVLMALRDRMTVEEATDLGAQLPMLVRGFYYENWNPAKTPTKERTREQFLDHVAGLLDDLPSRGDPAEDTRAVFQLLSDNLTGGIVDHVKNSLPGKVRELWP